MDRVVFLDRSDIKAVPEPVLELLKPRKMEWSRTRGIIISNGKWNTHKFAELCKRIREWKIRTHLYVCYNFRACILTDIQDIYFSGLKEINLGKNEIESIEGLNRLKAPHLRILVLNFNHISNVAGLRKCCFPLLVTLQLYYNPLLEVSALSELGAQLTHLSIASTNWQNRGSGLVRIESTALSLLRIKYQLYLSSSILGRLDSNLFKKWRGINIRT